MVGVFVKGVQKLYRTRIDLKGQRFGRLVVISFEGTDKYKNALWLCKCDCGNEKIIGSPQLRKGITHSCGCLHKEQMTQRLVKHNGCGTRLYRIWALMLSRTTKPSNPAWKDYGGRGITVCEEWKDFTAFFKWANDNGYKENLTIDRRDNDKGYSPDNCRWVTMSVQNNNRRSCVLLTYNGETHNLHQWEELLNLRKGCLYDARHRGGKPVEEIIKENYFRKGEQNYGIKLETV
jgi:hypothetical protein